MRRIFIIVVVAAILLVLGIGACYAKGSDRTWAGVGKGLAIYEGVKVLTNRQGNIVDDVTGGMKPAGSQQQGSQTVNADDVYNAGYKDGYQEGYNAGFKHGTQQASGK